MTRRFRLPAILVALVASWALGIGGARAQSGSSGSDSSATGAAADSAVVRDEVSTDGAITVFQEAFPGEGIDGFYWVYDPLKDLERLLDTRRRTERLEPLVDPYGFQVAIPESIRALRDSVTAVADSILA
jgi:hypothetical protein